jgi:hypothetical protein
LSSAFVIADSWLIGASSGPPDGDQGRFRELVRVQREPSAFSGAHHGLEFAFEQSRRAGTSAARSCARRDSGASSPNSTLAFGSTVLIAV